MDLFASLPICTPIGILIAGSLAAPEAHAQDAPGSWTANDQALKWRPCPAFIPESCEIAVLRGAPTPTRIFSSKWRPHTTVSAHSHTSVERMVLVPGEMRVAYEGYDSVILTPGTYAHDSAERPHDAYCAEGEACVLFIAFEEPIDAMPADQIAADQ